MNSILSHNISVNTGRSILWISLLLIFITGCIQKFDYEPTRSDNNILVVSGSITNQPQTQYIELYRTTIYGSGKFNHESGALIVIFENSVPVDTCIEYSDGNYRFDGGKILPKPGNKYSIVIGTRNGKIYRSDPEVMPEPVKPDSAYFEVHINRIPSESGVYISKPYINIYINTPVTAGSTPARLRWHVLENYSFREINTGSAIGPKTCYMWVNPIYNQDIQLYDGSDLQGGILKKKLVLSRSANPGYEFAFIHYFLISQYNLTPEAFTYWSQLQQVANPSGSFLDPPPAAVIGNIHNINDKDEIVLGYFEAAGQENISIFTVPTDLSPLFIRDPCTDNVPSFCFDCLKLPYSSLERPSYWHN